MAFWILFMGAKQIEWERAEAKEIIEFMLIENYRL